MTGLQPNQMVPLLRLFDGKHGLSDVVEESPFRIFDTIRMIRRLVEGGVLSTRVRAAPVRPAAAHLPPGRAAEPGTGPQSMLGPVGDGAGPARRRRRSPQPQPAADAVRAEPVDQPGVGDGAARPGTVDAATARSAAAAARAKPFATPGPTPLPTPVPTPSRSRDHARADSADAQEGPVRRRRRGQG